MKLTYTDCDGVEQPLDEFHLHELLDRVHCMQETWELLITNHPASHLVTDDLEAVQDKMRACYNVVGQIAQKMETK